MTMSPHDADPTQQHTAPTTAKSEKSKTLRVFMTKATNFLERIKHIPWFSMLFTLMLIGGGYQVVNRPNSPAYAWCKQSIQRFEKTIHTIFSSSFKKEPLMSSTPTELAPEIEISQKNFATIDFSPYDKKLAVLDEQLGVLEKRFEDAQVTIGELKQANDLLKSRLDELSIQVEPREEPEPLTQLEPLETLPEETPTMEIQDLPEPLEPLEETKEVEYSVHAVIEGRAWLNTQDGKILTVNVGSQLPPFGTVQAIDAENRLVYFEDGRCIGPSREDS